MAATMTMPHSLRSTLAVDRKISPGTHTVRFELLSDRKRIVYHDSDEHRFSRKSLKYWDKFYKRHQNKFCGFKFFKDRHYLEKDWGNYFSNCDDDTNFDNGKVLLEIGCGAGNTIFPLIAVYPKLFVHACDFSPEALALVESHPVFKGDRISLILCDVSNDELCDKIPPASVDVVTLIFMLSAISPTKMPFVLQNLKKVLKPNGHILLRDYAIGDSAQAKLENRNQIISDNFYFRGDGTCSYYFSEDFLSTLFAEAGFDAVNINTYCRKMENRSRNMTFQRNLSWYCLTTIICIGAGYVPFSTSSEHSPLEGRLSRRNVNGYWIDDKIEFWVANSDSIESKIPMDQVLLIYLGRLLG